MNEQETKTHLRKTVNLAESGQYECWFCHAVKPLNEGIVVTWGGHVFFAMCPQCFDGRPISISSATLSNGKSGIRVGFQHDVHVPAIELVKSEHAARTFIAKSAIAQRVKRDLPNE